MTNTTIYVVQPFGRRGARLIPATPVKMATERDARRRAERVATMTGTVGAVALSHEIDGAGEVTGEPVILARFGETPEDD